MKTFICLLLAVIAFCLVSQHARSENVGYIYPVYTHHCSLPKSFAVNSFDLLIFSDGQIYDMNNHNGYTGKNDGITYFWFYDYDLTLVGKYDGSHGIMIGNSFMGMCYYINF